MKILALLALLALTGFSPSLHAAATVHQLPATAAIFHSGSSTSSYPFNLANATVQTNYTAAQMNFLAGKIEAFGLQFTGVVDKTWPSVKIYMGEGDKTPASWSTTFAANANIVADQLVFDGKMTVKTTGANQLWTVPMDNPFNYSGKNTLVVTIRVAGSASGSGTVTHMVAYSGATDNLRMYDTSSATATTGSKQVSLAYGAEFHISAGITWTGAVSSSWTEPGNWDGDEVPVVDASVVIPDAATTANDPTLPANGACLDLTLEAGGILIGGSGELALHGSWTNDGGNFVPGSSLIRYVGVDEQEITTGGRTVGSIRIEDTQHPVTVKDEWSAQNAGLIELVAGAEMVFLDPLVDFSSNTFDNLGQLTFGLTDKGVTATLQTITTNPTASLGNVFIEVLDAMDTVEFPNSANFNKLTLAGLGTVNFLGSITVGGEVYITLPGALSIGGNIDGLGVLHFSSPSPIVIGGNIDAGGIVHDGAGDLTLSGDVTLVGDCNLSSTGATSKVSIMGDLAIGGDLTLNSVSAVAGDSVEITGSVSVGGATKVLDGVATIANGLTTASFEMTSADNLTINGGATDLGDVVFASSATLQINGASIITDFQTNGTGNIAFGNSLNLSGSLMTYTSGTLKISGNLTLDGASQQLLDVVGSTVTCSRLIVSGVSGGLLTGPISCTSTSSTFAALSVDQISGLVLGANAQLILGSAGGAALADIRGALTSTEGASSLRPVIRAFTGATSAQFPRVWVRSTARLSLDGATFNNIGSPAQDYALQIDANSVVSAFNSVTLTGVNANIAAIKLATDDTPTVFHNFSVDGNAPANIDATLISNKRIEVREAAVSSGNLYGVPFEVDPNNVLFWQNPPVLGILGANVLPSVLAENFFSESIPAVGGNAPMSYTLLNAPSWMFINPVTGELSGTPPRSAVGVHTFAIFVSDSSSPSTSTSSVFNMAVDALTSVGISIITPPELLDGKVGEPYGFSLAAAGGDGNGFVWALINPNALPRGLHLSPNGVISGQVEDDAAGLYSFAVTATDSQGNVSVKNFTLKIETEFSGSGVIAGALSDGPGGGCALSGGSTSLLTVVLALLALSLLFMRKRRLS